MCSSNLHESGDSCRFDLMHIMIDEPDEEMDTAVAKHIIGVHQQRERAFNVPYTMGQVQRYIKYARAIMPRMTPQVYVAAASNSFDLSVTKQKSVHNRVGFPGSQR